MSKARSLTGILRQVASGQMSAENAADLIRSPQIAMSLLKKHFDAATLSVRCFDVSSCPHHATTPITISEYSDELAPYPQLLLTTYDEFGDEEPLPDHPLARLDFNPAGLTFQGLFQTHLQTSGLLTTAWRPIVLGITLSLGSADSLFPDD